jgi:hypothetical protein
MPPAGQKIVFILQGDFASTARPVVMGRTESLYKVSTIS